MFKLVGPSTELMNLSLDPSCHPGICRRLEVQRGEIFVVLNPAGLDLTTSRGLDVKHKGTNRVVQITVSNEYFARVMNGVCCSKHF
mgnify:CR=1 FL=1